MSLGRLDRTDPYAVARKARILAKRRNPDLRPPQLLLASSADVLSDPDHANQSGKEVGPPCQQLSDVRSYELCLVVVRRTPNNRRSDPMMACEIRLQWLLNVILVDIGILVISDQLV